MPGSAGDRRVRLVGDVEDEVVAHRPGERLARARERGHVRGRAAADERARRLRRVADPLLEPAEHLELDLARPGRLHPRADVEVAGARDQVAERARPGAGERDEAEEGRVAVAAREREDVAVEPGEDLVEGLGLRPAAGRAGAPASRRAWRGAAAAPRARAAPRAGRSCGSRAPAWPRARARADRCRADPLARSLHRCAVGSAEWKSCSSGTGRPSGAGTLKHTGRTDVPLTSGASEQARGGRRGAARAGSSRSCCRARCGARSTRRGWRASSPSCATSWRSGTTASTTGAHDGRDPRAGPGLDDLALRVARRRERRRRWRARRPGGRGAAARRRRRARLLARPRAAGADRALARAATRPTAGSSRSTPATLSTLGFEREQRVIRRLERARLRAESRSRGDRTPGRTFEPASRRRRCVDSRSERSPERARCGRKVTLSFQSTCPSRPPGRDCPCSS